MAKATRIMREHLSLVDVLIEILDARIPFSSRNPEIDTLARDKKRIIILNKADLAAPEITSAWRDFFISKDFSAIETDARSLKNKKLLLEIIKKLTDEKRERQLKRGRKAITVRAMVAGIPNSGKSTFINSVANRAGAATGDKPGVTRGRQWIKINESFELLDTPGILWPKFEEAAIGINLAATGAVSDDILDRINLCEELLRLLTSLGFAEKTFAARYKLSGYENKNPRALLEMIGEARGFKMKGGAVDLERAAVTVLDEFREGRLGRVSLERP